ncbi:hypothetical protein CAPTEDRAFT_209906 [Capitella teleta]|uniref:Cytochrome P450 n=1 Tax=Capitella teleta TaxID=283909 RepID=R7VGV1_CAPTE|nr:hypothetical protein CAPTEDRAFT_209906 [Capitella teleta]|eukprot:ELU15536.1 hypothetical protein CAPTEDRAFT_209906 [Capitella teleta]
MESYWITALCSFGAIILSAIWIRRRSWEQLPNYRGLPVFGNMFQVKRERPELTFTEWAKDLGPVFSVKMLLKQFVVLISFEAIYEALVKKGKSFSDRATKDAFRMGKLSDQFVNIVSMPANSTWVKLRKVCHKKIKMYDTGMKRIEDISTGTINHLIEAFKNTKQESFNPSDYIYMYNTVMNTIMTLLLCRTFSTDSGIFKKIAHFEQGFRLNILPAGRGAELDFCPWLRFFGNETYKQIQSLVEVRNQIWELIKEEALRGDKLLQENEEDVRLVTALKDAMAEEDSELSEKNLRGAVIIDIVFAGTSTTSNSLCIYLNIITRHPEVQTKLQEEVDKVVGSEIMATIPELLRYSSVAPLGATHMSHEDTDIQGKNPQPERFLGDDGGLVSASHHNRRHLMPFGAGPRVCLGEVLAKSRIFLIITSLAQKFDILPGKVSAPCDPRLLLHGAVLSSAKFEIVAKQRM